MIGGREIDIGEARLHVHDGGLCTALPPIVLEAGNGSILQTWSGIEQALVEHTRVLAYERAGIGRSSAPCDGVLSAAVARRLDALLEASKLEGRVILVGHSLGGLFMRYYAATRPGRVAGLVLLDTTPQDFPFPRFFTLKPAVLMWLLHGLARVGLLDKLVQRLKAKGKASDLSVELVDAIGRPRHVKTVLEEISALETIQAEVAALALARATPVPTLTISAGKHDPRISPSHAEHFRRSHEAIAAAGAAPYSRHHRFEEGTHMSMLTEPANATRVAALILDFARQIAPGLPA